MSHLLGYMELSFEEIEKALGENTLDDEDLEGGDGKTAYQYSVFIEGHQFYLYEYKDTSLYSHENPYPQCFYNYHYDKPYRFHVGGTSTLYTQELETLISKAIQRPVRFESC